MKRNISPDQITDERGSTGTAKAIAAGFSVLLLFSLVERGRPGDTVQNFAHAGKETIEFAWDVPGILGDNFNSGTPPPRRSSYPDEPDFVVDTPIDLIDEDGRYWRGAIPQTVGPVALADCFEVRGNPAVSECFELPTETEG